MTTPLRPLCFEGDFGPLLDAYLAAHADVWTDPRLTSHEPGQAEPTEWLRVDLLRPATRWAREHGYISAHFSTVLETLCRQLDNHFLNQYGDRDASRD